MARLSDCQIWDNGRRLCQVNALTCRLDKFPVDAVLIKKLIQQPITSSRLLVCDPFRMMGREELVKEVIGLANARVDGPRHILFGVNPGAMEGSKMVGMSEDAMADLKKAHRHVSELVEPPVSLAFIFDELGGKLVGALEISGCHEGPFVVGQQYSKELARGKSWVRDGRELSEINVAELEEMEPPHEPTEVLSQPDLIDPNDIPPIAVGFNDDPEVTVLELSIPDTSDPPFGNAGLHASDDSKLKQTIRDAVNTVTTRILSLARSTSGDSDPDSSTDVIKAAEDLCSEADNHYYYEQKAVQLNLIVCNKGTQSVSDVRIELAFPKVTDFDIADRIYTSPFDRRSQSQSSNVNYPQVEHQDNGIVAQSSIGALEPNVPVPALKCALRMAVGPAMENRKLAILYTLYRNDQVLGEGRLKIQFGKVVS